MITKTLKERATSLILTSITIIGGVLVSEQVISGEQLASIQGVIGMALSGGGFTALTVIYIIKEIIPAKAVNGFIEKVGKENIQELFDIVKSLLTKVGQLESTVDLLKSELLLERQAKAELGAYEELSKELKDKLNV